MYTRIIYLTVIIVLEQFSCYVQDNKGKTVKPKTLFLIQGVFKGVIITYSKKKPSSDCMSRKS